MEELWHEILPDEDFLLRPRMSRIFYQGKYYDYPLKAGNALRNLGLCGGLPVRPARTCGPASSPPKDQTNYEGWLVARFGWRLYRTFFKTYTEKVWGVPVSEMPADWAAQRVKNLDLGKAVLNALTPRAQPEGDHQPDRGVPVPEVRAGDDVGALPGPGREAGGGTVLMGTPSRSIHLEGGRATAVTVATATGAPSAWAADHVISSMPMHQLVEMLEPPPPDRVLAAGSDLHYRDFLTVALVVPEASGFPDNWIYIHAKEVEVGRIQNFGSWSPFMVKEGAHLPGARVLRLRGGRAVGRSSDEELIARATRELAYSGWSTRPTSRPATWSGCPRPTPTTTTPTGGTSRPSCEYLDAVAPNIHPVGRNGMHKYNNQDHSMYTAMLTVENILGAAPRHLGGQRRGGVPRGARRGVDGHPGRHRPRRPDPAEADAGRLMSRARRRAAGDAAGIGGAGRGRSGAARGAPPCSRLAGDRSAAVLRRPLAREPTPWPASSTWRCRSGCGGTCGPATPRPPPPVAAATRPVHVVPRMAGLRPGPRAEPVLLDRPVPPRRASTCWPTPACWPSASHWPR